VKIPETNGTRTPTPPSVVGPEASHYRNWRLVRPITYCFIFIVVLVLGGTQFSTYVKFESSQGVKIWFSKSWILSTTFSTIFLTSQKLKIFFFQK
jgi:hypothetical protein